MELANYIMYGKILLEALLTCDVALLWNPESMP